MFPPADPDPPDLTVWYREEILVHEASLRAYLRRAFPIVTDPDNVVQETFVRVLRAHQTRQIDNVRGYLFATARYLALNLMRRKEIISMESIAEIEDLPIIHDGPGVADQVSLKFDLEILTEAIQSLPPRCRDVLTLRKIDGLSQREIAGRMGISEHTVEAQVTAGMRRCAQFLRQRGLMPARKEKS
ncbi:MAG: RNA polymerase sigma factor [Verrucomicrobia bacterium]|nr:RNA polymerase sigma factor [Verrucomicrobiota bacterium]